MKKKSLLPLAAFLVLTLLWACDKHVIHENREIQDAMDRYAGFTRQMNADSLSAMYTEDGVLGGGTVGPQAIKAYLETFTNTKVMDYSIKVKKITVTGDSALWEGFFHQKVMNEKQDTFSLDGELRARWYYDPKAGWKVRGMDSRTNM